MLHEIVGNMHDNGLKFPEIVFYQLVKSCVDQLKQLQTSLVTIEKSPFRFSECSLSVAL